MIFDATSTILALALLGLTNAQMVSQIADGQIQNPAPTTAPTSIPEAAPAPPSLETAPPAATPYPIESAAIASNATYVPSAPTQVPASLAGPRVPLYSANMTVSGMATGTGGVGGNASAPTVPAVPTGAGVATTEGGAPREAGTSAPAVVGSGAGKGRAMAMAWAWVGWGVLVAMMG